MSSEASGLKVWSLDNGVVGGGDMQWEEERSTGALEGVLEALEGDHPAPPLPSCHEVSSVSPPPGSCHDMVPCLRPMVVGPTDHGLRPLKS